MRDLNQNPLESVPPIALQSGPREAVEGEYLSPEGVAQHLGVTVHAVRAWRKRGMLPPACKFGKLVRWIRGDIDKWAVDKKERVERRSRIAVELGQAPLGIRRRL